MHYDKRSTSASPITMFGLECPTEGGIHVPMLGAKELLTLLRERGIKNAEIGRVLNLPSSRVAELFSGVRRLQLDEAKVLVERYDVEETINPVSEPIARLLVLHLADRLGTEILPDSPQVEELARDVRAFSQFATNPKVRQSVDAFEGFLQGLRHAQGHITSV